MLQLYVNIKERRKALRMTQEELAHRVGYADKGMIAKIEKGQVDISNSKIMKFAEVLETDPGDLMGRDGLDLELTEEETGLIQRYRLLDDFGKGQVHGMISGLLAEKKEKGVENLCG